LHAPAISLYKEKISKIHCTNTNVYMYITFRKDWIVHVDPTFSLIVDCLKSSGKYLMDIQDAIEFNNI